MRAIMWELKWSRFETPSEGLWYARKDVLVLEKTERAIKIKKHWWSFPKWYAMNSIGFRFELLEKRKTDIVSDQFFSGVCAATWVLFWFLAIWTPENNLRFFLSGLFCFALGLLSVSKEDKK